MKSRRKFSREFKQAAIRQMAEEGAAGVAQGAGGTSRRSGLGGGEVRTSMERRRSRSRAVSLVPTQDAQWRNWSERSVGRRALEIGYKARRTACRGTALLRALNNSARLLSTGQKKGKYYQDRSVGGADGTLTGFNRCGTTALQPAPVLSQDDL